MIKPEPPYEIVNLEGDFKLPYKNYGEFDKEVLKYKYFKLTNKPTNLMQIRFTFNKW